jgi:outer membrane protein OmpA-like peptidoglycan-associated protein
MKRLVLLSLLLALAVSPLWAQQSQGSSVPVIQLEVSRSIKAVNYLANKSTHIDFAGTPLMARAEGKAKVESKQGRTLVQAEFERIASPSQFGAEYLTYVLWAVTPEGRPTNLGEVMVKDGKGKLTATTRLQSFGLMVTAEPYFAVTYPSDAVVVENAIRPDTSGAGTVVEAKYELFRRGRYHTEGMTAFTLDPKVPLDVYQARNAMRIAKSEGADHYAADSWTKAEAAMARTEDYLVRKQKNAIPTAARETVQIAEDSRLIALRRKEEERVENERRAAAEREAKAKAEKEAAEARQQAEERKRMEAQLTAAQEAQKRAEAEAARQAALLREREAAEQAKRAEESAAQAEREKQALRARLLEQFNRVLDTRDTPRGLVVNLGDVLFDTGRADLRAPAREALARLSGIVLNYPELKLDIEGHTDNTGGEEFNQKLSEQRAESVQQYLQIQGIPGSQLSARGFGETMPVADNANAAGRQKNRRVEIVVSGEVIGTQIGAARP